MNLFSSNYILFAIIAVGIFTLYMAVMHMLSQTKKTKGGRDVAAIFGQEPKMPASAQFCEAVLKRLNLDPNNYKDTTAWLSRAGLMSPYATIYYMFFNRLIQPVLLLGSLWFFSLVMNTNGTLDLLLKLLATLIMVVGGTYGAKLYIQNLRAKRMIVLTDSFPETLDLLLVCIESGLGLDAALNRVCKEMRKLHPVMVSELDRLKLELNMLGDRTQALQNMAERIDTVGFKTLTGALMQTERFGTSLVDTLRVLSEEQRISRIFAAEQKAARIPVLITLPLILCIMPAFIMIILGPPMIKLANQGGLGAALSGQPVKP